MADKGFSGTEIGGGSVKLVDGLLSASLRRGASDVHFEPTDDCLLVRVRLDGQLRDTEEIPLELAKSVVARLKVMAGLLTYRIDIPQEGGLTWSLDSEEGGVGETDLRVATFPTIRGERVVVRVFRARSPVETLDQLGLASGQVTMLKKAAGLTGGLVLVTGPAGSGKSTTLYAMVRHMMAAMPEKSVITLEDPVEQRLNRVTQIQINPHGELSYERALRSLLRQDPQVILMGEIRDAATAAIASEASLTGHLILSTMHSGDPAEAIVRLFEMGIPAYQVVSSLAVVVSQRLLRRVCTKCGVRCGQPSDCEDCLGSGYAGRIVCSQIVRMDESLRQLILSHPSGEELRNQLISQGPDLRGRAGQLIEKGITDAPEVCRTLGERANL